MATLQVDIHEGIATLTLSRPERKNALNTEMKQALEDAIVALRADASVRALVLTGAGGAFCSGGDLSSMQEGRGTEAARKRMTDMHRTLDNLLDFDRPVIAAVDGVAYGAGFSLALAADLVVASPRARFCLSFARVGLVPDVGSLHLLPRLVGLQRARALAYSARELPAQEALELGLVLELHASEQLLARAQQLAKALAGASPAAFAMTKQLFARTFELDRRSLLDAEANAQAVAFGTEYFGQAVEGFMRGEKAKFHWPSA
jgi:enoyl-CoA hydratase/carnithine racemase